MPRSRCVTTNSHRNKGRFRGLQIAQVLGGYYSAAPIFSRAMGKKKPVANTPTLANLRQ